ncbi:MAG: four helix bundle protein [Saprospiraceae bacterium]|nr:four helix bundle protein [Saprospiraceae bacterium]
MPQEEFNELFRQRTKQLALSVIKWYSNPQLRKIGEVRILGEQLIRSVTSTAANYRAVCRARSEAERFSKLCIVVEEADETTFWMEMFMALEYIDSSNLKPLYEEAMIILKVMAKTRKNLKN